MSAEMLRKAARLMRERAETARAGEWYVVPSVAVPDASLVLARWEGDQRRVATCAGSLPEGNEANADHIASWHPAVAFAVADWLETIADLMETHMLNGAPTPVGYAVTGPALTVARAYLGAKP